MPRFLAVGLAGLMLLLLAIANAQAEPRSASLRVAPPDSVIQCVPDAGRDSITLIVVAELLPFESAQHLPPGYAELLLDAIAQALRPPSPLALRMYTSARDSALKARASPKVHLALSSMYGVTLFRRKPAARPASARVLATSMSPTFDMAILRAVAAADSQDLLDPPDGFRADSIEFRIVVESREDPARDPRDNPPPAATSRLFQMRVPQFVADPGPEFSGMPRAPHYPDELRRRGMEGEVRARFVVGPDGAAVPGTTRLLHVKHADFATSLLEVLPSWRFKPLRIGRCTVPMQVDAPLVFSLRR